MSAEQVEDSQLRVCAFYSRNCRQHKRNLFWLKVYFFFGAKNDQVVRVSKTLIYYTKLCLALSCVPTPLYYSLQPAGLILSNGLSAFIRSFQNKTQKYLLLKKQFEVFQDKLRLDIVSSLLKVSKFVQKVQFKFSFCHPIFMTKCCEAGKQYFLWTLR